MNLHDFIEEINSAIPFEGELQYDEPMSAHTTFKTGGKADLWVRPAKTVFPAWTSALLKAAKEEGVPVFILGGGANLLVSDLGIRGIVLDTGSWEGVEREGKGTPSGLTVKVNSGTSVDSMTGILAAQGLSGLEFLAGMPGSAGGAVWMNARCYDKSVSDVLVETEIIAENFEIVVIPFCEKDFSYKKSPFQNRDVLILSAVFRVSLRDTHDIEKEMVCNKKDREEKGQFRFPSAGSIFKNNPAFGAPSGKIIDELGLRGMSRGGAQIAPWHGNFIINTGGASSSDIRFLIEETAVRVKRERGIDLEPEIIFAGQW